MVSQTSFSGSPDDLKRMLQEVVTPLVERIRELEVIAGTRKHAYTVAQVAELIGYKPPTVLTFIHEGRKARNGKTVRLRCIEPTSGDYRVLPQDLDVWLSHF